MQQPWIQRLQRVEGVDESSCAACLHCWCSRASSAWLVKCCFGRLLVSYKPLDNRNLLNFAAVLRAPCGITRCSEVVGGIYLWSRVGGHSKAASSAPI